MIHLITLFEGEKIEDKDAKEEIKGILKKIPDLTRFFKIEDPDTNIKVENYVGFLQVNNIEIDILPKIWKDNKSSIKNIEIARKNFIYIFSYAVLEPKFLSPYRYFLKENRINSLKEFILLLYAYSLLDALKKGICRTYVRRKVESNFLRGKLLLLDTIRKIDKSKFVMEQFNLDANNKLNQILSYCSFYCSKGISSVDVKEKLLQILYIFNSAYVDKVYHKDLRVTFNRLNERFEIPYNYALLLLKGEKIYSDLENKTPQKMLMFLYDMNLLLERFLYNFISRNKKKIFDFEDINCKSNLIIEYQQKKKNFIYPPGENKALLFTIPDIKIICDGITIIIDAKNKIIDIDDLEGISSDDLYQMFTYSSLYNADAVLYYPTTRSDHQPISGPYKFYKDAKRNLWISTLSLDFSENWEEKLIKNLKEDFYRVLKNNQYNH